MHSFCSDFDGTTCLDGMMAAAPPLIVGNTLYGTTAGDEDGHDRGVVYKVALGGAQPKYTVLHRFCALSHCSDGARLLSGLTMDASGNLFGSLPAPCSTACTATGAYAPGGHSAYFLEAWNGRTWRLVTAPHPFGFVSGALNGTSCVLVRCTAVGYWSGGPISVATLAMAS